MYEPARQPEDLGRFFVERAAAADVDGLVALYEPDAVLALHGTWLWAIDQPRVLG